MSESHFRRPTYRAAPSRKSTVQTDDVVLARQIKDEVLNSAYDEYRQMRASGQEVSVNEFCERYPTYRKSLRRYIDVQETLFSELDIDPEYDPWPEPGSNFCGFEILQELGVGAMARVFLAAELELGGRLVALKVTHERDSEADTLGKLSHPNVVPVHSVKMVEEEELAAVCMPYLGSGTLADAMELLLVGERRPSEAYEILAAIHQREQKSGYVETRLAEIPVDDVYERGSYADGVAHIGVQLAEALSYTHARGVYHRDLKPSNILIAPEGRAMLLDFNLSREENVQLTRLGGTLPYMAPEQIREVFLDPATPTDGRSDIYSLGVMLYEMLTGKLPFAEPADCGDPRNTALDGLEKRRTPPKEIRELNPSVDARLATVIQRCLCHDPTDRPGSAAELAGRLRQYFHWTMRLKRSLQQHWKVAACSLAVLVLVSASAVGYLVTRDPPHVRFYQEGLAHFEAGRFAEAATCFDESSDLDRSSMMAVFARGVSNLAQQRYKVALIDLVDAQKELHDPIVLECLAYAQLSEGDAVLAAMRYEQLASLRPKDANVLLFEAYAYSLTDTSSKGYRIASEAIELDPELLPAYHLRAEIVFKMATRRENPHGSPQDALEDIDEAIRRGYQNLSLELLAAQIAARYAADDEQMMSRMISHLSAAVTLGAQRKSLIVIEAFAPFVETTVFQGILERCRPQESEITAQPIDQFVSRPDRTDIQRFLAD